MEADLASLHQFLNPSTIPATQDAPSDFENDEKEAAPLDKSAEWAKNLMENWGIWSYTGVNLADKKKHKRASSVSLASLDSKEDTSEFFKKNHASVKENLIKIFLDLAKQVDAKKRKVIHKETFV